MNAVRAIDLARGLGLSRRTVSGWCKSDPALAYKKDGVYWIRIDELGRRPGFDPVSARLVMTGRWIKAAEVARLSGIPRRTIAHWCAKKFRFAKRVRRCWYLDLEELGASESQIVSLLGGAP